MNRLRVFGATLAVAAVALTAFTVSGGPGGGTPTPTPTPTATPTPTPTPTPGPAVANVWVQQGGGGCGSSSSTEITFAAASSPDRICGSFDAACQAMSNGQLALVMGSTSFGAQTLSSSCNGASGAEKRICVAPGETVTITAAGGVRWANADYVWVCGRGWGPWVDEDYGVFRWEAISQNFAGAIDIDPGTTGGGVDGWEVDANGFGGDADVTACKPVAGQNAVCTLQWAFLQGSTDFTIRRSDMCCNNDKGIYPEHNGTSPNTNLTIEKNWLHDQVQLTITTGDGAHYEIIYNNGTDGLTIRQNWFEGGRATGHMNTTCVGGCLSAGDDPRDVLIENNIFGRNYVATSFSEHSPGIDGCLQCEGFYRIRNNYIKNGVAIYDNGITEFTGNVMGPADGGCGTGATWTFNIRIGGSGCGATNQVIANALSNNAFYADADRVTSGNYCPSASSPTIGAGSPTTFPSVDYLDRPRSDGDPDAGPYEGTC